VESINIPVDADLNVPVLTAKTKDDDVDDVGDGGVEGDGKGDEGNGSDIDSCGDDNNGDDCVIDGMEVGTAG